jgi:hypothetical protein
LTLIRSLYPSILPMQQVDVSLEHMPSDSGGGGFLGDAGQGGGGEGAVKWPLLFIYQEHQQTDFLRQCAEDSTIDDHLQSVLDPALAPPPWDSHRTLSPSSVSVYYISHQTPVSKDGRCALLLGLFYRYLYRFISLLIYKLGAGGGGFKTPLAECWTRSGCK